MQEPEVSIQPEPCLHGLQSKLVLVSHSLGKGPGPLLAQGPVSVSCTGPGGLVCCVGLEYKGCFVFSIFLGINLRVLNSTHLKCTTQQVLIQ